MTNRELQVSATAVLRVEPDVATVSLAVEQNDEDPKRAFGKAKEAIAKVQTFVADFNRVELRSSGVHLRQIPHQLGADKMLAGKFNARIGLTLLIKDLRIIEPLLVGILEAGANQLVSTEYTTSQFKVMRDRVRQMALSAAQEKAIAIAEGAGVKLGPILRLSEGFFDPNRQAGGHVSYIPPNDAEEQLGADSPGSVAIGAGMNIVYELI